MTNVTMKAADTLHVSSVKADNIAPGEQFEVSPAVADDLEARGLAKRVKAEKAAPENKMEEAPDNKGIISAFDHDGDGKDGGAPKGGNKRKLSVRGK